MRKKEEDERTGSSGKACTRKTGNLAVSKKYQRKTKNTKREEKGEKRKRDGTGS